MRKIRQDQQDIFWNWFGGECERISALLFSYLQVALPRALHDCLFTFSFGFRRCLTPWFLRITINTTTRIFSSRSTFCETCSYIIAVCIFSSICHVFWQGFVLLSGIFCGNPLGVFVGAAVVMVVVFFISALCKFRDHAVF
jgi:hypothetical protein